MALVCAETEVAVEPVGMQVCVFDFEVQGADALRAAKRGDEFKCAPAKAAPAHRLKQKQLVSERVTAVKLKTVTVGQDDVADLLAVCFDQPHAPLRLII